MIPAWALRFLPYGIAIALVLGGVAYRHDLPVEVKGLARERVVRVDLDLVARDLGDGHDARTLGAGGLELHSLDDFDVVRELAAVYLDDELVEVFAVGIRRGDGCSRRCTGTPKI